MDPTQLDIEQSPHGFGFERSISDDSFSLDEDSREKTDSDAGLKHAIGRKEIEGVKRWKVAVALLILLTAAAVITSTYKFLTRAEGDQFIASVCLTVHCQILL